jgi:hypothetical protein
LTRNGIEHRPKVVVGSTPQNGVGGDVGDGGGGEEEEEERGKRTSNLETAPQV